MSTYKSVIISGLVKDVTNQTQVHQLKQLESPNFRIRKALSENEQSLSFSSFLRWLVTGNISYLQEICRKFCPHDNCNIDLEFGNGMPTKVMIRKSNAAGTVFSCVINFRALMSDFSECRSERRLYMITHDDKLLPHLSCCPQGAEIYICPSENPLVKFCSSFHSGGSEEQEDFAKVILMTLDDNDSFCNFSINPDIDEIKEFTKNDKEAISTNSSNITSSNKSAKRKSSSDSDRADKSAKNTKTAAKNTKTGEAPKTPEMTKANSHEPQPVEITEKSKDPKAPKKPVRVFYLFARTIRRKVTEENPSFNLGEISKELGKRYRHATAEELQPFQAAYNEAMKAYRKELEEYKKKYGGDETTKKVKKKKYKKSEIKRSMTSYMFFSLSKGPELKAKGIKPPQSGKLLGMLWRELPDSEKVEFIEKARKDRERYLKELEDAKAATTTATTSTAEDSEEK